MSSDALPCRGCRTPYCRSMISRRKALAGLAASANSCKLVSPKRLSAWLHCGEELSLLDVREAGQFGDLSHRRFIAEADGFVRPVEFGHADVP